MFNFFKKKPRPIRIECTTDCITIESKTLDFPTNYSNLVNVFGEPSRKMVGSKNYIFWDDLGVFCGCIDLDKVLSVSFYQAKKGVSEYNTTKQFTGELFFNDQEITNNEFDKIQLGRVAIHRLGSEYENRYGFSLGLSNY